SSDVCSSDLRMIQKLMKRFAAVARIHGSVNQFAQVLDTGKGFRRVFFLKLLDVTSAVNKKFQYVGGAGSQGICSPGILPAVVEVSGLHFFARHAIRLL